MSVGSWALLVMSETFGPLLWASLTPTGSARLWGAQRPWRYANARLMVEPRASVATIMPALRRQEKALLEQIEFGPAKHLAFEHR